MASPTILVDAAQPPQVTVQGAATGSKGNGTKTVGTASVALSLASLVGVSSVLWEVLEVPSSSAAALSSATSTTPTFGALDKPGRYLLSCTTNGNALERTIFAISVPTRFRALHVPGTAETKEWDASDGWATDLQTALQALDGNRVGRVSVVFASDADRAASAAEVAARILDVTSGVTLTATRSLTIDPSNASDPWWVVTNRTTGGLPIKVIGLSGTGPTIPSNTSAIVFWDGTNMRSVPELPQVTGYQKTQQTLDATVTTAINIPMPDASVFKIRASATVRKASTGDCAGYEVIGTFKRHGGGGATLVGALTNVHVAEDAGIAAFAFDLATSGNSVLVRVTGAAATTANWHVRAEVESQVTP